MLLMVAVYLLVKGNSDFAHCQLILPPRRPQNLTAPSLDDYRRGCLFALRRAPCETLVDCMRNVGGLAMNDDRNTENSKSEDWDRASDRLRKSFKFRDFPDVLAFMVAASGKIEQMNHHPEWRNVYRWLHVELTTHSAGGITELDEQLAAHLDRLYADWQARP